MFGECACLAFRFALDDTTTDIYLMPDVLHTIDPEHPASPAATRVASMCCITVAFLLHGTNLKWGLRVQNALGATKLFILVGIALTGLGVLVQAPGFHLEHVRALSVFVLPPACLGPERSV